MIKIWAKTYFDKKIVQNELVIIEGRYNENNFDSYVREVCRELDIPGPVIVSSNASNFTRFNITKWKASDFVESVPFEELTMENCPVAQGGPRI